MLDQNRRTQILEAEESIRLLAVEMMEHSDSVEQLTSAKQALDAAVKSLADSIEMLDTATVELTNMESRVTDSFNRGISAVSDQTSAQIQIVEKCLSQHSEHVEELMRASELARVAEQKVTAQSDDKLATGLVENRKLLRYAIALSALNFTCEVAAVVFVFFRH